MRSIGRLRTLALICVASSGLVAGHHLTYLLLTPDAALRLTLLERTGHGYWDAAVTVAGPLAFMALLFVALMGSMQARAGTHPRLSRCALLMATVQVAGFGIQEVVERMMSGATAAGLEAVLPLGLVIQLAVAALATLLFVGLHRAGQLLGRMVRSRRPDRPARRLPRPNPLLPFISAYPFGALRSRGPPALP